VTSTENTTPKYDNRIHPFAALRAWKDLRNDKEDTGQVFRMIGALKGKSTERAVERMKQSETGRRLLSEKPNLVPILEDREKLRTMPDGSLGRAYLYFMESEGFTAQGLIDASAQGGERREGIDPDVEWMGNRLRDLHDLFHVSTGYGRDPLGELCVVALGNVQNYNRGIAFLVFMGHRNFRKGVPNLPITRCFKEAKARGRDAVFLAAIDWESLLDHPMEDVRKALGLTQGAIYDDTSSKLAARAEAEAA
jgi:ubiquinone biosynthesis protein COQ4